MYSMGLIKYAFVFLVGLSISFVINTNADIADQSFGTILVTALTMGLVIVCIASILGIFYVLSYFIAKNEGNERRNSVIFLKTIAFFVFLIMSVYSFKEREFEWWVISLGLMSSILFFSHFFKKIYQSVWGSLKQKIVGKLTK